MTFRRRIALVSAAAVAIAVVLATVLTYLLTSDQLHSQVDHQLHNRAREARALRRLFAVGALKAGPNGSFSVTLGAAGAIAAATSHDAEGDLSVKSDESSDLQGRTPPASRFSAASPTLIASRPRAEGPRSERGGMGAPEAFDGQVLSMDTVLGIQVTRQ